MSDEKRDKYLFINGLHCITKSLGEILVNNTEYFKKDIFNESMFFGLDTAVDCVYRSLGKTHFPHYFIGGRKPNWLEDFSSITGINITRKTCVDNERAERLLLNDIDSGKSVLLEVDKYCIDYWKEIVGPEDYGGHLIVAVDYDKDGFWISDQHREGTGLTHISFEEMRNARSARLYWKPPENSYYEFAYPDSYYEIQPMIIKAIHRNSDRFLNYHGNEAFTGLYALEVWENDILNWYETLNYMIVEPKTRQNILAIDYQLFKLKMFVHGGNIGGGGNFRYIYSEFLSSSSRILQLHQMEYLSNKMKESGDLWKSIAEVIQKGEIEKYVYNEPWKILQEIKIIIKEIEDLEKDIFNGLHTITGG